MKCSCRSGNDAIHALTKTRQVLRIELLGFDGDKAYASYSSFYYGDEADKYNLLLSGYSGNAGKSVYHIITNIQNEIA
jgi:hypothetical protein